MASFVSLALDVLLSRNYIVYLNSVFGKKGRLSKRDKKSFYNETHGNARVEPAINTDFNNLLFSGKAGQFGLLARKSLRQGQYGKAKAMLVPAGLAL